MNDLNSVYLVGRLIADPKLKATEDKCQGKFTLANNVYRYDEGKKEYGQNTIFFDIVVYGKDNEKIMAKIKKGTRIGVNGRLNMTEKINKDGEKKSALEIVCYTIQLLVPSIKEDKNVSDTAGI